MTSSEHGRAPADLGEGAEAKTAHRFAAVLIAAAAVGKTVLTRPDVVLVVAGLGYMASLWALTATPARRPRELAPLATALLLVVVERSDNEALFAFAPLTPVVAMCLGMRASLAVTAVVVLGAVAVSALHGVEPVGVVQVFVSALGVGLFLLEFSRVILLERAHARMLALQSTRIAELSAAVERQRVAQQIHDSVGHYLSAAVVHLEAARLTRDASPAKADAAVSRARELVVGGMTEVRRAVTALRDRAMPSFDEAIVELVQASVEAGIDTRWRTIGAPRRLAADAAWVLYAAVQESLTNVRKHAGAKRAEVVLRYLDDEVELVVTDDGRGAEAPTFGNGLTAIAERARAFAGELRCDVPEGGGFRITTRIRA